MNSNFLKNALLFFAGAVILLPSCEKSNNEPAITADNLKGMFVTCEENYGSGEGDITYYNPETKSTIKNLYYSVNGVDLGDVVQSFAVADTLGFIVVNNSQKVTVVNLKNFTTVKTIKGFSYPRSIVRADKNTMYVTDGNGTSKSYIYSIDLITLKKTDSLDISNGPESMIAVGSKVYAAISGGWKCNGNTVIEVNPETFTVSRTFQVSSIPVDLVADNYKNIWVYCKGATDYSNYPEVSYTGMGLSKINLTTNEVSTFAFSSMTAPGIYNIAASADGKTIYYLNDGLYAMSSDATSLPSESLVNQSFYGVDTDPETDNIICLDAANSKAVAYNKDGVEQFSFGTGKFPNSVIFSY